MAQKDAWRQVAADQSQLIDFVATVKQGMQYGLADLSLQLVDVELYHQPDKIVLTPSMEPWALRCIILNPATRQMKETYTQFQGAIGDTDVESVKPMVMDMIHKVKVAFYGM